MVFSITGFNQRVYCVHLAVWLLIGPVLIPGS